MGKSLAGDFGRLTFSRGAHAATFNLTYRPLPFAPFHGEGRHAR